MLFILSNTQNQRWFISQRQFRAYKLLDSDEFYLKLVADKSEDKLSTKATQTMFVNGITGNVAYSRPGSPGDVPLVLKH